MRHFVFRAVGMDRQTDDKITRLPLLNQFGDCRELFIVAAAGNGTQGWDSPNSASPCATPIRASPKSNASAVPWGALCMADSGNQGDRIDTEFGKCGSIALFVWDIKQDMFVGRNGKPCIVGKLAFELAFSPA